MIAGSTVMAEPLAKAKAVAAMALKLYSTLKMRRGGASGNKGRGTQKRKFCVDAALSNYYMASRISPVSPSSSDEATGEVVFYALIVSFKQTELKYPRVDCVVFNNAGQEMLGE